MIGGKFIDIAGKNARPFGRPAQFFLAPPGTTTSLARHSLGEGDCARATPTCHAKAPAAAGAPAKAGRPSRSASRSDSLPEKENLVPPRENSASVRKTRSLLLGRSKLLRFDLDPSSDPARRGTASQR